MQSIVRQLLVTIELGEVTTLSVLVRFTTGLAAGPGDLAISEIHYRPLAPSADEIAAGFDERSYFEFVELTNIGTSDIDLASVAFVEGIQFQLGDGQAAALAPGERALIVNDLAAFTMRYPQVAAALGAHALIESLDAEDGRTPVPTAAAGSKQVLLGEITPVGGRPAHYWLRAVMDNLTRGGAVNALEIAASVLGRTA